MAACPSGALTLQVAGGGFALDQGLGKGPASGKTTGPAVRVWQQVFHLVNSGILVNPQLPIGYNQYRG